MIFAIIVSSLVLIVATVDWAALRKHQPRALALELVGLFAVVLLALFPQTLGRLAGLVGIGRGVDLVVYPMLIWLFREAILGRVRYHRQQEQATVLIRRLAQRDAVIEPRPD